MKVAYVVTWRYSDGSGSGAVAVFSSEERARAMLEILTEQGGIRTYLIEAVPSDPLGAA